MTVTNTVQASTAIASAQEALRVGDLMSDGTIVYSVDLKDNTAVFMPGKIFAGKSDFDHQNDVVNKANKEKLHGYSDWRRVTNNEEASKLAENWRSVARPASRGIRADVFWGVSVSDRNQGRVFCGNDRAAPETKSFPLQRDYNHEERSERHSVPVFRTGPAIRS